MPNKFEVRMLSIIAVLFISIHGLRAMDCEEKLPRHGENTIKVKINHHNDLAQSLVSDCKCPEIITEESFAASYPLWKQVNALDTNVKNELLQKTLDQVNDYKYNRLRGAIACLIAAGAYVEQSRTNNKEECALEQAAMYQDYPMAKFLLEKGANPNRKVQDMPLFFWLQSERIVELFLQYKLNPHVKGFANNSIFHKLTDSPDYPASLIALYLKLRVNLHHKNMFGYTPLMSLAFNSSSYCGEENIKQLLEKAKVFINNGISITEKNEIDRNAVDLLDYNIGMQSKSAYALKTFLENYSSDPVEEISHLFREDA